MKRHSVKATIYATDALNIRYAVCLLEQIHYEDERFEYIFTPKYPVIELLDAEVFQGIPGLDLSLRKERYVRKSIIPTFIYERTPQENREDLWMYLDQAGMEYLDHLEWLIRTDYDYTGDHLTVDRYTEPKVSSDVKFVNPGDMITVDGIEQLGSSNFIRLKILVEIIAKGAFLKAGPFTVDDDNRKSIHHLIYTLYRTECRKRQRRQKDGIEAAKKENRYTGRQKIDVAIPLMAEVVELLDRKEIKVSEAMERLGLKSRSTFYRRVKEFRRNL